jgi:signal transduction histidine kinase
VTSGLTRVDLRVSPHHRERFVCDHRGVKRPILLAVAATVLAGVGILLGVQEDNLHNGLLAVSLVAVGAFVLQRRPGQREAELFVAAGAAQAVMFLGRQVGGHPDPPGPTWLAEWIGWLGIWPLPLVLLLVGAAIMCYPDGRFPSPVWRASFRIMFAAAVALALTSALWPVDYDRAGLVSAHPFDVPGVQQATTFFDVAQPTVFILFQVVWLACVVARYRRATAEEARQLRWLVAAMSLSLLVLITGLAAEGSPRAGLLTVWLIPVAAGVGIVEASYEALTRELRAASRRVVGAHDEARRRIERDLHDGAQHRLVVLGMDLGRLVDQARSTGDPTLTATAVAARDQLLVATAELRDLARGIHPSVLTHDGLAAALETLADSSQVPVHMDVDLPEPCPAEVEVTTYFIVAEALTNAARHSAADHASVLVRSTPTGLLVQVEDDGRGGATEGGGIRGLHDRVLALGGQLTLASPPGGGTRLTVVLPWG